MRALKELVVVDLLREWVGVLVYMWVGACVSVYG